MFRVTALERAVFCQFSADFRSGGFVVFRVSIFFHNFFPRNSITGQFEKVEDWLT